MMKTPKIEICDAIIDHLDPLCGVLTNRSFQDLARNLQQKQRGDCDFIVGCNDGAPVGYALVYWQSEFSGFKKNNAPEIVDMIVAPTHHRRGIASHILTEICTRLSQKGYTKVGLTVSRTNTPACALYHNHGFFEDEKGLWDGASEQRDALGIDPADRGTLMLIKDLVSSIHE